MELKITKRISYFFNCLARPVKIMLFLSLLLSFACVHSPDSNEGIPDVDEPGQTLHKKVHILAVIPTALGNYLAREYTYQLNISN